MTHKGWRVIKPQLNQSSDITYGPFAGQTIHMKSSAFLL